MCGKGAPAAAVTATVRHSLRAAATHIRDEQRIIQWVHDAIISQPDAPYCTIVYAVLDLSADATLRVVLAGHDQGVSISSTAMSPIWGSTARCSASSNRPFSRGRPTLTVGDLVVFHTDGVTDAPRRRGDRSVRADRPAGSACALDRWTRSAGGPGVLDERRQYGDRDDTALLLLRCT